jgi:hypothetical protein
MKLVMCINERQEIEDIIRTALQKGKINCYVVKLCHRTNFRDRTNTVLKGQISNVTIWWLAIPSRIREVMGLISA